MSPESSSRGSEKKQKQKRKPKAKKEPENALKEASLINISQTLEKFRESDMDVYTFDAGLQNLERKAVHTLSRKMGMKSKSQGKGEQRRVSVYKTEKASGSKEARRDLHYSFSEGSKAVLQDLFSRCPPSEGEMTENKFRESSGNSEYVRSGDDMFSKPSMNASEIANKAQNLASKIKKSPELQKIAETRSKLPIASFRDDITSTIESNQVVLICGETGCGKTTQVPQFILDHAWSKGESCKIVCTQPRRISAVSVAERIASERGETVGDSIGYKIRLESKGGRHSLVVFCTNGVLLKVLVNKGSGGMEKKPKRKHNGVSGITHIIVDEIHERDRFSDFILAIIRDLLPSHPHLRLVMMSATIDAERFSQYFYSSPILRVPGLTYPVKTFYLEDVLSLLGSTRNRHITSTETNEITEDEFTLTEDCKVAFDEAIDLASSNDEFEPLLELFSSEGNPRIFNHQHSQSGLTPLMVFSMKERVGDVSMLLSLGVDCNLRCNAGKTALDYTQGDSAELIKAHVEKTVTDADDAQKLLDKYIARANPEMVDCVLIEQLLMRLCKDSEEGAILVFLPGWEDITRMRNRLLASPFFSNPSKFFILSLHSMVPSSEQKKVFNRPPRGSRKIVLSTNIAETSVTIDDVVYVVDTGRMKEKNYDPYNNVSTLHSSWISRASAKQREGRAGRCQPGVCYHLYSKHREASLTEFQIPEIKRMPIEELCLQVRLIDRTCKIEDFLQKLLDPPVHETIHNGILFLQEIGALTLDEKLTDLGEKLGSLPVHPQTSKMLLVAILLNCLDPALTLACASEYRDPFILPMDPVEKSTAETARYELASLYGGRGDQLAVIAAFEYWRTAKKKGEDGRFCSKFFLSSSTMRLILGMRDQLLTELVRCGLIQRDASHCSLNSRDPGIVHAVVAAGLYPMIGRTVSAGKRFLIETCDGNKVRLHQRSAIADLLGKIKDSNPPLVGFDEITRGDGGMYIRKCSLLGSLPLLLLSTDFVVAPLRENDDEEEESDSSSEKEEPGNLGREKIMSSAENNVRIVVDRWLSFESVALDAAQMYCLRERLSAAVLHTVTYPGRVLPPHLGQTVHAIACILSFDGVSEISSVLNNSRNNQKKSGGKMATSSLKSYLTSLGNENPLPVMKSPRFYDRQRPGDARYNTMLDASSSREGSNSHKVSKKFSKGWFV